ncbi:MAG: acyltransferase family protein [Pediococcus acidilactici]|jgi:fucose 4-O-acetylase-like acetyltransferase|nr:acyltransferase family protein [Pediococcus acidilactici]
MAKRIQWIDFGKGITMLLVVLGHVSLGLLKSNMFDNYKQLLTLLIEMVYVVHMPVFFALSGYFFKFVSDKNTYFKMVLKKIITLGIPYLAFSIIIFLLKSVGGVASRILCK